ncbi:unnamed protein product [Brassica oleracea var. botrytis]|uniref:(rape) hypothetical protein n=1 Tax=Brassica napus TaxID=3708 RepID=A0A816U8E7_BRANA|nr:unnamed protein product [Brassica napus]
MRSVKSNSVSGSPLKSLGLFHLEFCFSRCLGPFSMRAAPYLLLGLIIICDSRFLFLLFLSPAIVVNPLEYLL